MNYALGVPKGLRAVLQERGVDTSAMNADAMRTALGSHADFKQQRHVWRTSFTKGAMSLYCCEVPLRTESYREDLGTSKAVHPSVLQVHNAVTSC